jgi:competence protein ComEA
MKTFTAVPRSLTLGMLLAASALLGGTVPGSAAAADRVNINTADAATIDAALLNIGRAKAEAIVAYRKAHGAFHTPEQLAQVKGIGLKTIEKNRDRIVFGAAAPGVQRPARPAARPAARPPARK